MLNPLLKWKGGQRPLGSVWPRKFSLIILLSGKRCKLWKENTLKEGNVIRQFSLHGCLKVHYVKQVLGIS